MREAHCPTQHNISLVGRSHSADEGWDAPLLNLSNLSEGASHPSSGERRRREASNGAERRPLSNKSRATGVLNRGRQRTLCAIFPNCLADHSIVWTNVLCY